MSGWRCNNTARNTHGNQTEPTERRRRWSRPDRDTGPEPPRPADERDRSAREAGLSAATATIGRTVLFVTSSLGIVTFPKVAALHERGEHIVKVLLQGLLGALVLSAAVEVVLFAAPAMVVRILFGPTFAAIAPLVGWYGLAMLSLAVAGILMAYFLAVGNRTFVLPLLSCCMLQAALIVVRHSTASQLVQAVVTANAVLVITLLVMIVVRMRWDRELRVSGK